MSIEAAAWTFYVNGLQHPLERLVLMSLSDHTKDEYHTCETNLKSLTKLSEQILIPLPQLLSIIDTLEDNEYLEVEREKQPDGSVIPVVIRLCAPVYQTCRKTPGFIHGDIRQG